MNYDLYMYFISLMDRVKQFGFLMLIISDLLGYFSLYLYNHEIKRYRRSKTKDRSGILNAVRLIFVSCAFAISTLLLIFIGDDISVIISVIINIIILIIIIFIDKINLVFEDEFKKTGS